jgi:hypothetical protein
LQHPAPCRLGSEEIIEEAVQKCQKKTRETAHFRTPFFVNMQMIAGTRSRNANSIAGPDAGDLILFSIPPVSSYQLVIPSMFQGF